MPLYEYRKNAVNFLKVPAEWKSSIVTGGSEVADFIVARIAERQKEKAGIRAAFEGWYGVDWPRIMDAVKSAAGRRGYASHSARQRPLPGPRMRLPRTGRPLRRTTRASAGSTPGND